MSASHTSEKTSHSPGGNKSHTSGRAEDHHTLGNCDSHIHVSMISEELISRDGSSGEATTSSGELLSSVINGKRSMSTSEKREASILTAEKHHETPTTITTTATACATTTTTTMGTLTTSDTSTRTQEATVSPVTTTPPPDCTDRHGGMWPMESVSEGQTQGEREEGPSPSCSLLFPDAVDLDVPQCSPDVVVLSVQEPQFLPEKIVLLIDRQDAYLRSFSFSNVHQIYDPKLNFGNAFDLITKTLPAFQKNTLFVMLCGTMSALRQVINEKCFLFQCKEPLYNYTLQEFKAPSLDEFLISEAKNLRKNIIEMNNCDVIFTGVLPVRINCAERYEAAKHYTQTGHQVKLACSRHDALYAQLCSGLREFNRWAKTDAASKGFPQWSLVDMLTTSDAVDSSQHFTHPTQADGVTLTGECMMQRRVAIRTRLRETFLRSRKASQSLKLPQATADEEEVKVVAVVPRQCNYKPEAFMQPRETELDEVVLLADQMYRTNLTPLARKRMCLITEVKLSPERIAKVVQRYYSKVPKDKKITWILCLGIYNFVEREHNRVCLTRQCKKKLIGIIDEDSKGSLYQKIHSALSTIKNFKSALEKALPKKATLVVAPPLPSALLGTDTFKGNHTQSHIIAMRYRLCLCSPLTYCFIRRFYMQMFDLWVNTVMKLEGGTCAELMSRYITEYKDKSLRLVDASHSNNYVKRCGKEWNNMMRNVISSTLTSTSFITGLSGLQRSVYLSRLSNVILLESSKNRGQTLTYSLQDKPDKTDYSFKQVVVVGNQMPAELDELCHRLSIHVVPHRVTFDEAGKTLITKYENLWPHNTLWVILTDVLHLIAAKPLPACEAVKCKDPIPVFGIEMPSNKNATNLQSYIKVKVDVFISKVKIFFDSLIDKLGEESAVFLPPVTPVFLMRPDLQESHQTLHAMYDSFGKIAMVNGKPKKWRSSYSLLKKAWLEMLEPYLEHYSVPKRILQLYSTSNSNQDWIKTLGELLVHFATTTNIGESDAVFSDAEFSSGEEDMMEVTEAMVATTAATAAAAAAAAASSSSSSSSSSVTLASVPTCSFQAMSTPPAQTQAAAGQGMQHEPERTPRQQQQNKGAVMWSGAQKQWHVVKEKEQLPHKTKRDHTTPMIEERQEKKTGEDEDLQGNKKGQKTPRKKKVLPTMEKRQWHDETDKSLQPPRKKICQETAKPEKGQQPPRIEKDQEMTKKDQVIVKMEEDQSIVKMEQFQDVIKSEEFEDMGRSEEVLWSVRKVEGGGGDRQLSNLEKDAWIILSQTDEDKNIGFPERDHLSNYLEDTAAASGTLAQSQTHIRKTEGSLTEPGNSSTALTWVPKSEELESSHCEDDASDTLARDGLWEDIDASVLERNMEESCCKQDVDESGPKEDLEESGSKQNIEQRIPRKDLDGSELTEKRLKEDLNESGPKQNTEQHGPNYDIVREQEYIFNLSDDSDIFECEPEGGAGGEDQITKEVVVGTPLRGSKTEGDVEVTCLPNRKRKLSSSGQDSPAPSCSSYNSSFDSDQEMKKLFLMLEEGINQTYQVNLQTFMQVPEVHPDYEAKHAEFLKSYKKQHEGKEHDEEHHERSWGEFWEDTVGKQLHEDWEKSKKELVEQFRVIESNSKNSSSSNSTREDQPKQMKRDESDKENQKFQSYSSNPQPLLSVCHKKSESSPLSVNRSPKTNPKHSSDFESCETDMMQFKQLLSEINPGTMSSELKRQALQLDMDKVMTSDTKKRVHLILSSFALLSELGRSLDSLAPAVVPIIKAVLDKEVDSEEALNILAKKDNVEVLKKCTEKLMLLSEKARGAYKNKLLRCVKNTIELLENVTTSLKTIKVVWGLDIPSIAKATAHQDMTHVLQFIRNTLASKGVHNPSRSMLNELFLSVSSQHFNLAIQTQPPTSPDPSK
ncbi:hypothetical protein O3P69_008369 [Scylla paramamosain]|uniref:Uncharacterized protein n=1 Tax=Scylla paramamosain TaxID=85552 RepID=A0AAW0SK71_SCYPA